MGVYFHGAVLCPPPKKKKKNIGFLNGEWAYFLHASFPRGRVVFLKGMEGGIVSKNKRKGVLRSINQKRRHQEKGGDAKLSSNKKKPSQNGASSVLIGGIEEYQSGS